MKNKVKNILLFICILVVLGLSAYLLNNNLTEYAIVSITVAAILLIILLTNILKKHDELSQYNQELNKILKKYDAILVETSTVPNIEDKNIMLITNIEDMIDASIETRKPIYYKKEEDHCIFVLLDNQDTCIYILKLNKEEETAIEVFIKEKKEDIEELINIAKKEKNKKKNLTNQEINAKKIADKKIKENDNKKELFQETVPSDDNDTDEII